MQNVQDYYRQHRETYPEPFRLRMHRALSWLEKAEKAEDLDTRFITLWIAFNAAYARELDRAVEHSERADFRQFLQVVCRFDKGQQLYQAVWQTFSGSIRVLLENRYVFQPFWDFHNGYITQAAWEEQFARARKKAQTALANRDTDTVLAIVFDRLYTLRNQMVHGGATFNSSANRSQLKDGCAILGKVIPLLLLVMQQQPDYPKWGKPFYPFVKGD